MPLEGPYMFLYRGLAVMGTALGAEVGLDGDAPRESGAGGRYSRRLSNEQVRLKISI